MYIDYPKNLKVETPIGDVVIAITDNKHCHVEGRPVVISGKEINLSLHMYYRDGMWTDKNADGRTSLYARKAGTFDDATNTQKEKALKAIVPSVESYMQANPYLRQVAQKAHVTNVVDTLQGEIAILKEQIAQKEMEIMELKLSCTK